MCEYPPPPTLSAALLAAPWLLLAAGAIIGPLGLWLLDRRTWRHAGRVRPGLPGVGIAVLLGYGGAALVTLMLVSSLAWQAALLQWDVSQIDRLERASCPIATLEAVDALFGQQTATAGDLLRWGALGAAVVGACLLVRLVQRPRQRS